MTMTNSAYILAYKISDESLRNEYISNCGFLEETLDYLQKSLETHAPDDEFDSTINFYNQLWMLTESFQERTMSGLLEAINSGK